MLDFPHTSAEAHDRSKVEASTRAVKISFSGNELNECCNEQHVRGTRPLLLLYALNPNGVETKSDSGSWSNRGKRFQCRHARRENEKHERGDDGGSVCVPGHDPRLQVSFGRQRAQSSGKRSFFF